MTIDLNALTFSGNVNLGGTDSIASVETQGGSIVITLGEKLTMQPAVAGGSIAITGNQFDIEIGGVVGDRNTIQTEAVGSGR